MILGLPQMIKTEIIAPNSPGSHIETRYISSEGRDDNKWLGYLRDDAGVVDLWLITYLDFKGTEEGGDSDVPVGTFTKPISVVLDYYADYKYGVDSIGDVGSETKTNTEREFLKKVFAVDYELENRKGCLQGNILISGWDFRLKLRRFETATTHWMSGVLSLEFTDLFLNT